MRFPSLSTIIKYGSAATLLAAGFLFFTAHPALAQTDALNTVGETSGLTNADLKLTIANIIRTFLTMLGVVAVCICLYGGWVWMTAGGEADKVDKAKKILLNGVIGLAIILLSWAITSFIISALVGAMGGTPTDPDGPGGPETCVGCDGDGTSSFIVSGFRPEGEVEIRNVQVSITLTKSIESSTVTSSSVVVADASAAPVTGTLAVSGKRITFTPDTACPTPNEDRFCFAENAPFTVTVTTAILSTSGVALDCASATCTSTFTTGSLVDTEDPRADVTYPDSGQRVTIDSSEAVQVEGTDDSQIATADFAIDDVIFDSVVATGDDLADVLMDTTWYTDGLVEGQRYSVSATVTDIAGNTDSDQVTVRATAASCDDDEMNGDETDVDCGGSCGACDGAACETGADCASGHCDPESLTCVSPPIIASVTPGSGAPGTYVTIAGTDFGSSGTVTFTAADGGTVEATLPSCSDGWSDTSIVVEVPATAIDGPIELATYGGLTDATNDDIGLLITDFDVNDVEHPNLCRLSPSSGKAGTSVNLTGTNFGETRGESTVVFGSTAVGTYSSWSDTRATLTAPTADADTYAVGMTVGGVPSNTVSFEMTETETDNPVISYLSPESGGEGQYVTIVGSGFGITPGSVFFVSTDGFQTQTLGSIDFPAECSSSYWTADQITIIVPTGLDPASFTVQVYTHEAKYSNAESFTVDTSDPTPGICLVDPSSGAAGAEVDVYGEHLGTSGTLSFYNGVTSTVIAGDWASSHIATTVPTGTATGPVQATVDGTPSNTANFEVTDASTATLASESAGYAWIFYTGEVPDVPEVYQECSDTRISGVPNNAFTTGGVCVNAEVFAEFTMVMDSATFTSSSVVVEECTDSGCGTTTAVAAESGYPFVSESVTQSSVAWIPNSSYNGGEFKPSTTYRVTLTTALATPAPNSANLASDVSWKFTTAATADACTIDEVRISPNEETLEAINATSEFNALPVTGCVILNAASYAWDWTVDDSYASILEGICEDTDSDSCAVATAKAEGVTDVTAAVSTGTEEGSGTLTINFTDPYVEQTWPACDTACLDADVGAQFNTAMNSTVMQTAGNVLLYQCTNELCLSLGPTELIDDTAACANADCSQISFGTMALTRGTYYKGVITGSVTSTSGVELTRPNSGSDYVWFFKTKDDETACAVDRVEIDPAEAVMTYIGESQTYSVSAFGAPDDCSVTGQHLTVSNYNWAWQDPIQNVTGVAEWYKVGGSLLDTDATDIADGCTASCLPGGSTPYTSVCGDSRIGTGEDCDDGGSGAGDGCSASCLAEGRAACAQTCSGSGATCDADSDCRETCNTTSLTCSISGAACATTADCTYAASTCEFTGSNCCGNGLPEAAGTGGGEECDDGNASDGDGCSARCVDEGSRSVGATCGNSSIGQDTSSGGEDCDDGNRKSGDGCSADCLNEGTPERLGTIVCGDGSLDAPYESCDDSNTADGDGCSSSCLREGSAATYSLFTASATATCGDGHVDQNATTNAGEDCDSATDEGCSESCTWIGSSLSYAAPSICGDGTTGTGEVIACESGGGDAKVDASQVSLISDDAGDYVDLVTHLATTTIHTETENITDDASLYLSCVADEDSDCPSDAYGVNQNQCCELRPTVALMPSGTNVCRNAALYGSFSKEMNTASFTQGTCSTGGEACTKATDCSVSSDTCSQTANAYVSFATTTTCPAGYSSTPPLFAQAHESWFARVWHRMTHWFTGEAEAAATTCYLPITGITQTAISDGTYKVSFIYGIELEASSVYTIHVEGDTIGDGTFLGVLSASGVPMDGDADQSFTTGTEICTLDQVDVADGDSDSPEFFSTEGETHDFTATPYSYSTGVRQEITSIADVYAWTWDDWQEDSGDNIVSIGTTADNVASIDAVSDGQAAVVASATIVTDITSTLHCNVTTATSCTADSQCPTGESCVGKTVNGTDEVTVLLCGNPWPDPGSNVFPLIDDATSDMTGIELGGGWMNFSTYYCRDVGSDEKYCHTGSAFTATACTTSDDCNTGESCRVYADTSDDYQAVSVVRAPSSGSTSTVKEYLFQYGDSSGDAIGVRIVKNASYLSPMAWYQSQGFDGSPQLTTIDGIEAVRDGRTVYVAAPNIYDTKIYPNMYVISYDEGASDAVVNIFDQMVTNFGFMTNVTDTNLCYSTASGSVVYTSETCESDFDCAVGETCGSDQAKLARDMERLIALTDIESQVSTYGLTTRFCSETSDQSCSADTDCPSGESCTPSVPTLASGSYVRAMSASAWPSWTTNLGEAFGIADEMPTDPLNLYNGCGTSPYASYNADTCVNETTGSYLCPANSYALHYRSLGAFDYQLGAELEYGDAAWYYAIDSDGGADGVDVMVGGAGAGSATGFSNAAAFCDASVFGTSNTCGDGIVGATEDCEIGETSSTTCDADTTVDSSGDGNATNDTDGTIRTTCDVDCGGFTASATATCEANECGDGVIQTGETCDDGSLNGQYGFCGSDCTYGTAFTCGDGTVAGPESCDCGSTTLAGRNYGNGLCSASGHLNGVYDTDPNATCSWDCSGPASYCGDGAIDTGEDCDGNTESYSGYLCRAGVHEGDACTPDASGYDSTNCGSARCGSGGGSSFSWADACTSSTVCIAGDDLGEACVTDADCDTGSGVGDGVCSDAVYDLARVKTCADDGASGDICDWNETNWKNITCTSEDNCGNGTLDDGEECDDGNDDGTDDCTTACTVNICGDGYLYSGSEECDEGGENGTVCTSAYGSSCTYCSTDCRYVASTGSFCGDGIIEGDEYCDAGDIPMQYYSSTYHTVYGTCSTAGGSSNLNETVVSQDLNGDGDETDTSIAMICREIGVCNGGDENGEYCYATSECTDGTCTFATCSADCNAACPTTFSSESILMEKDGILGASRSSSVTLDSYTSSTETTSFLITGNATTAYIPACNAVQSIALDIDDTDRVYPNVYVMFVMDLSLSMDDTLDDPDTSAVETRLDVLESAVTDAAEALYDAYDGLDADMHIGYVAFYGHHGTDTTGDGLINYDDGEYTNFVGLSPTTSSTTLTTDISATIGALSSSRQVGTPIFPAILEADEELVSAVSAGGDSTAKKYVVVFTDGNVYNGDYASLDEYSSLLVDSDGDGIEESEYLGGVTSMSSLMTEMRSTEIFTGVLSSSSCEKSQMEHWSSMDCTEGSRNAAGSTCSGSTIEGNVTCETRENGVQYAYSATTAAELEEMYQQIVDSILNITFTVTYDGESTATTVPSGNNKAINLPPSFVCDGTNEQGVSIKPSYNGSGSITLSGFTADLCSE